MPIGTREEEAALLETYLLVAIGGRHTNAGGQKSRQTWKDPDAAGHVRLWVRARLAEVYDEAEAEYVAATVNAAFDDALFAYFRGSESNANRREVLASLKPGQVFDKGFEHLLAVEASLA